jgi:hypothetical protein
MPEYYCIFWVKKKGFVFTVSLSGSCNTKPFSRAGGFGLISLFLSSFHPIYV